MTEKSELARLRQAAHRLRYIRDHQLKSKVDKRALGLAIEHIEARIIDIEGGGANDPRR